MISAHVAMNGSHLARENKEITPSARVTDLNVGMGWARLHPIIIPGYVQLN